MIVYFSGTGNSRFCAQFLAHALNDTCFDVFSLIRQGIALELTSEKPWVFVAPTYGWQLPRIFTDLIKTGWFSGSREAYFVMTCGSDIGSAWQENQTLCQEKNFIYRGTAPVVMPENYIAMFRAPGEEEAQAIRSAALPVLEQCAQHIAAGQALPALPAGLPNHLKSGPVNRFFCRFLIKAKPFYSTDACISCGKCVQACPLNNIQLRDGRPVWGDHCTHCMACICGCPTQAIEYGRRSRGKARYQCPDFHP